MRACRHQPLSTLLLGLLLGAGSAAVQAADYVPVPAGSLRSVLASDADPGPVAVAPYAMRATPVTRAEYAAFLATQRQWQREGTPVVFASAGYLAHWGAGAAAGTSAPLAAPVTEVSWFAARAFCASEGGRLPRWIEWEYAAAADATRADARDDPAWLARILGWYGRPADGPLPEVGGAANFYGVRDLHGVIWEWVDDFNALLVDADSRAGDDPDRLKFCGAGAISFKDRANYAVLMRIALLSSLKAADSTSSLGFRCVRAEGATP